MNRSAFTLIEVLIGVLILAIALLGLGAVIPVVVRQQQLASDAAQGVIVANAAQARVIGHPDLNRNGRKPDTRAGFGIWLFDPTWSWSSAGPNSTRFLWEPLKVPTEFDPDTGLFTLSYVLSDPPRHASIELADRLWPGRSAPGAGALNPNALEVLDPQFVWDIVARRVYEPGTTNNYLDSSMRVQVAIIVRRIDLSIRVPRGRTLFDVLTGGPPGNPVPLADQRYPVAVDSNGFPTHNGLGDYAMPLFMALDYDPNQPDQLILSGSEPGLTLAKRQGQRLVDNLGNVYTVKGPPPDAMPGDDIVVIEPPVPSWVPDPNASTTKEWSRLRQIVFTPQIPAAVFVVTLTPLDPPQ